MHLETERKKNLAGKSSAGPVLARRAAVRNTNIAREQRYAVGMGMGGILV